MRTHANIGLNSNKGALDLIESNIPDMCLFHLHGSEEVFVFYFPSPASLHSWQ